MNGHAEFLVDPDGGFRAAVKLMEALAGASLDSLAMADFERLVAALHRTVWGDLIACRAQCSECGAPFGFSLQLDAVTPAPPTDRALAGSLAKTGTLPGPAGVALRAPRLADVLGGNRDTLLRACCIDTMDIDHTAMEAALAEAFPTGFDDVEAACPECGHVATLAFDLCRHVAQLLDIERPYLVREIHLLAERYHWPLGEILSLPRADRRALVRLVLEAARREQRRTLQ